MMNEMLKRQIVVTFDKKIKACHGKLEDLYEGKVKGKLFVHVFL